MGGGDNVHYIRPLYNIVMLPKQLVPFKEYWDQKYCLDSTSVSDTKPDPDCIRIQLGMWIRIRIGDPDPESK